MGNDSRVFEPERQRRSEPWANQTGRRRQSEASNAFPSSNRVVSGGIGKNDVRRIGTKPDRRLASWGKGTVAKPASSDDPIIAIKPTSPVTWTGGDDKNLGRPDGLPSFFEFNVVRIDDELIEVGAFEKNAGGGWLLTGVYVSRANGEFDSLTEEVLKEAQK